MMEVIQRSAEKQRQDFKDENIAMYKKAISNPE
jgi:hypothetical protein